MAFIKAGDFSKTGREPWVGNKDIASRTVIGEHDCPQTGFAACIRKQKGEQVIKQNYKTGKYQSKDEKTVEPACEPFYIVGIVDQRVKKGK